MPIRRIYARHLPHQIPPDTPIFITWNLKGAMPTSEIEAVRRERARLEARPPRTGEITADRRIRESKILFAAADRYLDPAVDGPANLGDPNAARIVDDFIRSGAGQHYGLFAWCVMSNHVHVLLKPNGELKDVMQRIKGSTSFRINALQRERGRILWQDESYDHWVRDEEELFRIIGYIENNPVAAGLCQHPADWPWSSARLRSDWVAGEVYLVGKPGPNTGASG